MTIPSSPKFPLAMLSISSLDMDFLLKNRDLLIGNIGSTFVVLSLI